MNTYFILSHLLVVAAFKACATNIGKQRRRPGPLRIFRFVLYLVLQVRPGGSCKHTVSDKSSKLKH